MAVQVGDHNTQNVYLPPVEAIWPVCVGVVPLLADHYQERPEIAELSGPTAAGATSGRTHVLTGLGGVGKSQLAAALAHERTGEVDLVLWADAGSRDAVVTAYAQAALQVGYRGLNDAEEAAHWFVQWLRSTPGRTWLIVLDDVADPAHLRGLWPSGKAGSTSSRPDGPTRR